MTSERVIDMTSETMIDFVGIPTAQGAAHGGHKNRIYRSSESSLKCRSLQILVQSQ